MTAPTSNAKLLGYFCVQAIRDQLYGMIGRRRHVVAMYSPASIVDKLGDPALRIQPYGYGPISVVGTLVAAGDIGR